MGIPPGKHFGYSVFSRLAWPGEAGFPDPWRLLQILRDRDRERFIAKRTVGTDSVLSGISDTGETRLFAESPEQQGIERIRHKFDLLGECVYSAGTGASPTGAAKPTASPAESVVAPMIASAPLTQVEGVADNPSSDGRDRLRLVEEFVARVSAATGREILKSDLDVVAGYTNPTQRERFQRRARNESRTAAENFRRVLLYSPQHFIAQLDSLTRTKSPKK